MDEETKMRYKRNREERAAIAKEKARRLEAVKAGLEKIVVSEDSTTAEKLEAARLIAELDRVRH